MNKLFLRKNAPTDSHVIISGPPLCGKLSLARQLVSENALIIDLFDIRTQISAFSQLDETSEVIVANAVFISAELASKLALTKRCIITTQLAFCLEGFSNFALNFLDYEEFCSIYSAHNAMGDYLLRGRTPMAASSGLNAASLQLALLAELGRAQTQVLASMCDFVGAKCSLAQIFSAHTQRFRMGKNEFYACAHELLEMGLVFFIPDGASKRLFLGDFGMKNALSFNKNFTATFANLIACELVAIYDDLHAHKVLDFYSPSAGLGVVADAFLDGEFARLRFKKLAKTAHELRLKTILFLSLNMSFSERFAGVYFVAMELENYLLSKDESLV